MIGSHNPATTSVQRLRTFTTPDDIRLIHQLGFDHIRISIDAEPLLAWQRNQQNRTAFMGELDAIVNLAIEQKLAVIIDIHPETRYKQSLLQGKDPVKHFAMLWHSLATHFAPLDPDYVFFEIMNEPEQPDTYRWQGMDRRPALAVITAISALGALTALSGLLPARRRAAAQPVAL